MEILGSKKMKIALEIARINKPQPLYDDVAQGLDRVLLLLHNLYPKEPIEALKLQIKWLLLEGEPIKGADFTHPKKLQERLGLKMGVRNEVAEMVKLWISNTTHLPNNPNMELPPELNTEQARKYFAKAVELKLMDDDYKWLKTQALLACFARDMSLKLNLGKGVNSDGTPRISWRKFECLFGIGKGKLRRSYNDIQKTGQAPLDSDLLSVIFE